MSVTVESGPPQGEVSYARKGPITLKKGGFSALGGQRPSEVQKQRGMTLALCGRSNAGKTTLLNTLWDSKRVNSVAVADARGRTHVLEDHEGLSIFPIRKWADWYTGKSTEPGFIDAFLSEPNAFDVIVVDTASEIQGMDLSQRGLYDADDKMRLKIYGDSHMDMSNTIRMMYDLSAEHGVHVIFTLWVKPGKDKDTGADATKLMLTDQFGEYFRGIVDYIGYLKLGDAPKPYPPVLSFQPTNTTPEKFSPNAADRERMGKIPKEIYRPSLGHIIDTFMGDEFPVEQHRRGAMVP